MHTDPEILAMMAMDDSEVAEEDARHVATCDQCTRELRGLRRVAELARSGSPDDVGATPRDEVWAKISKELGFAPDVVPAPFGTVPLEVVWPDDAAPARSAPGPAVESPTGAVVIGRDRPDSGEPATSVPESTPGPTDLVPRRHRRPVSRRRWVPLLAAAVVVLVAGGIVATVALQRPTATVLAEAPLEALPDWAGATGSAVVEESGDGQRDVVITVDADDGGDGYREVWLITPDLSGLVSLGVLTGDQGRFVIPTGVDLADYSIVDVSEEPIDGDPKHSGDSIVRGSLS